MPIFKNGEVTHLASGKEIRIESFEGHSDDGREIYTVTSSDVMTFNGRPCNQFKCIIAKPTLVILSEA